jgi:hypothetical protein
MWYKVLARYYTHLLLDLPFGKVALSRFLQPKEELGATQHRAATAVATKAKGDLSSCVSVLCRHMVEARGLDRILVHHRAFLQFSVNIGEPQAFKPPRLI